ncbi:MAG: hypothetical protein ACHQ2E_01775, partial [Gemmatimonadales bacterium]
MSEEARRRLGAIAALVFGLFAGITLLPVSATGPIGAWLGRSLWEMLGLGAVGIPLLGFGIALAGLRRAPHLDMKRSAILLGGLSVLVPFVIGVVTRVSQQDFLGSIEEWHLAARLAGLVPGFLARVTYDAIGFAGALLLGFLALSALTLLTIAWHPLQRLEGAAPGQEGALTSPATP